MKIVVTIIVSIAAVVIVSSLGRSVLKKVLHCLPSGKRVPEDEKLMVLSVGELECMSKEDLAWLENYAMTKDAKNVFWSDFLRRSDLALNGF